MSTRTDSATPEPGTGNRPAAPPAPPPPISARGVFIGTVILAALLLGFAWWANQAGLRGAAAARTAPDIVLLAPHDGAVVQGAVDLLFGTDADLRRGPGGWEARGFHIHAEVDGVELMPGPNDVTRLDDNRYSWHIRPLAPGAHAVRLFWSDRDHREVAEGASRTVRVESR
jgi:hypothetical protein